jgi:hypothetical protein
MAIYYLAISFLMAHELDAVTHAEWRLLLVLRDLEDTIAAQIFVAGHVPLLFIVLWFSHHVNPKVSDRTKTIISATMVLHVLAHFALSGAAEYDFNGLLSRVLLLLSGFFAAAYLVGRWRNRAMQSQ